MQEYIVQVKDSIYEVLVNYIDIDFTLWLSWLLMPLIITFILPLVIVILLYISALILYTYKLHWNHVRTTFDRGDKWGAARKAVAAVWDSHGWIWHGFAIIAESMKVIPGTIQSCANVLKEGNLLAIAPGGVYESQFSHNYNLMWKKRLGFAKVALEAKVPIIPMFTENVREAFRTVSIGRKFFLKLYALTKFPFTPIYGGFPVKMITHIGKPINYDPSLTPEKLQEKVAEAIDKLIFEHQRLPGSITYGLLDRIPYLRNKN
ncbi:transmembrane protein 68 [Holotrichia oblita]|uniref:Transmembrane protein 68 n=1 Tax=Holotrichia oblita TaxID=644536 RepID=A0ACB9TNE0_HOLOL|nr:transmembrane protein 68 [Holotrichia oblita]